MEMMESPGSVLPDNEQTTTNVPILQKRRKRKNKNKKQKQLNAKKKLLKRKPCTNVASKTVLTMTAWAEQFTFATTWQLKHQLAYWKAKAKSLQYENDVLHDIIRKNYHVNAAGSGNTGRAAAAAAERRPRPGAGDDEDSAAEEGKLGEWEVADRLNAQAMAVDPDSEDSADSADDRQNLEVSEEFIQFLMVNAKHKEEIRLERERLKALEETKAMEEREKKLKARRHYGLSPKQLYGDRWRRISALEMSMKSSFMNNVDSKKPGHWPVIPFNFDS